MPGVDHSPAERLTFEGSSGDTLAGRLDLPPTEPVAIAVFAHCFTCSQEAVAASRISRGLVSEGIGVLRFDFTGLGSSQGEFANTNFSSNVEDLVLATAAVRARFDKPIFLVGHSLGGAAALVSASRLPDVVAVVTVNAPSDALHVTHLFPKEAITALAEETEQVTVSIGGRPFPLRRQFLADVSAINVKGAVEALGRPLLVFHSPSDEIVDLEHAREIYDSARHPKSFVSLPGATHLLTGSRDGEYVATVTAAWLGRYLPDSLADPLPGD